MNTASSGNDARNMLVLHKVQNNFTEARRYEVGNVAKKAVAVCLSMNIRVSEFI